MRAKHLIAQTEVLATAWKVGTKGHVYLRLQVQPVELDGETIDRVFVFHPREGAQLHAGLCAKIEVRSAFSVPVIETVVVPSALPIPLPDNCPRCGTALVWREDRLLCVNDNCSSKVPPPRECDICGQLNPVSARQCRRCYAPLD